MSHYKRKVSLVEARQHDMDTSINVNSCRMGMQTARKGDFLVVDHVNLAKLREQEKAEGLPENSLPDVGTIYVVSKKDFLEEFEIVAEAKFLAELDPVAITEENPAV